MRLRSRRSTTDKPSASVELERPSSADLERRRLVDAIDALPVGVAIRDEVGREVARNRRGASPVGDLQADALATAALARALDQACAGHPVAETLDIQGPPARVLDITATPLAGGGAVGVVADVSERRQLDHVRRDFIANVNHELRTPIGALGVLAEALRDETDPAVVRRLAERVSYEAARARALIEDLLDFSRIEAAPTSPGETIGVDELIRDAKDRVLAMAEQHEIAIDARGATSGATVIGDRAQFVSALSNLMTNAVKYSDAGEAVCVSSRVDDEYVEIAVTDRGVGIPARDLDRIFERFYRVDRARDRRTGGSGLGLAIVRHVAANHGGEVTVQSREGEGSTFTLRIPRAGSMTTNAGSP